MSTQELSAAPSGHSPAAVIRKRLLRGSAWVFGGKLLGAFAGVTVNALLARLLGHAELGAYFLIFSMALLGSGIAQLGMERAVVRVVSQSLALGSPGRARAAVRTVFVCGTLGALVSSAVLVLGVGRFLADHVYHSRLISGAIVFGAAWLIALVLQTLVAETLRGFQRFGAATLFGGLLVDLFSVAVFGGLWLLDAHPSLGQVVLTTVGLMSVSLLVGGWMLARRMAALGHEGTLRRADVLSLAWPLLVTNIASFLVGTGVDLWVVGAFRSADQVALYGAASRLVFVVATPLIIVSQVVPPVISELHAQGRNRQLEHSLRAVSTLSGIPAAVVLLVFLAAGAPIMGLVFGGFYREGAMVLAILSCARLFAVCTGSSGTALMMTGHQRTMMTITVVTGLCSLTGELLLVRPYGIAGVALATAVAQVMQNSLQLAFARARLGIWTHVRFSLEPVMELVGAGRSRP
ncbi:MAG: flippase [Gaiellales bacterium]